MIGQQSNSDIIEEKSVASVQPHISQTQAQTLSTESDHLSKGNQFLLTPSERRIEWIQVLTLCFSLFVAGWNDGTTGPLLPTYQRVYRVGYVVVSLLFIFNCLVSHFTTSWLKDDTYIFKGSISRSKRSDAFFKPFWVWQSTFSRCLFRVAAILML